METLIQAGLSNALSATVLAILVFSLGRLLRERPAVRHALWLLVLIKLVTPPLYSVPFSCSLIAAEPEPAVVMTRQIDAITSFEPTAASAHFWDGPSDERLDVKRAEFSWETAGWRPRPLFLDSPVAIVGWIWLMGTLLVLGLCMYRIAGFRRVVQAAEPVTDDVEELVTDLADRLGLSYSPSTRWIAGKFSPMVWALPGCRPRLLIPFGLWKTLDDAQRSSLIAHELAHLRRGDHRVRLFEIAITALYWWNPLIWWVRRALRDAEEQCCDAWVVWTFPDFAKSYAETLLETLDFLHPSDFAEPLLSSGFGKVDHLRKRLTMIMTGKSSRGLGAGGLFGLAAVASLLLPIHPTWAGKAEDEKRVVVITEDYKGQSSADAERRAVTITSGDTRLTADAISINVEPTAVQPDDRRATKVGNIHLKINSGDTVREIRTDSIDEAIKILEEQKALMGKTLSHKNAVRVVDSMEIAIKNLKEAKNLQGTTAKLNAEKREQEKKAGERKEQVMTFVVLGSEGPGSTEAQAKVAKAKERVAAIALELQSKQRELQKAERELDALNPGKKLEFRFPNAKTMEGKFDTWSKPEAELKAKMQSEKMLKMMGNRGEKTGESEDAKVEPHRISELEAKLQKLIDEVKSLKKDQKPGASTLERSIGPDGRPIGALKR